MRWMTKMKVKMMRTKKMKGQEGLLAPLCRTPEYAF